MYGKTVNTVDASLMWNHQEWDEFLWLPGVQVLCVWFYNYSRSKKKSCDQRYWDQNWKLTSLVEITSMTLQGPLANYKVGDYAAPSRLNWQLNLLRSIIIPLLSSVTLANDSGELEGFSGWVLMSLLFFFWPQNATNLSLANALYFK